MYQHQFAHKISQQKGKIVESGFLKILLKSYTLYKDLISASMDDYLKTIVRENSFEENFMGNCNTRFQTEGSNDIDGKIESYDEFR